MHLRVFTLNTHKGYSVFNTRFVLPQLREALRSTGADVVFLQEVVGENSVKQIRVPGWPEAPQYEFLAHERWPSFAYGKNAVYRRGHHGNAILSRYPIERSLKVDISTNSIEQRGFLYCRIPLRHARKKLHCFCLHLGLFQTSRRKQLARISRFIEQEVTPGEPLVIAGDFNDWQEQVSRSFERRLNLVNVSTNGAAGSNVPTFPVHFPLLPLDRIYVRNLAVDEFRVCRDATWAGLSDHAGLLADVSIARNAPSAQG
jgi:endonuclease/exonuclease/phosphatase family metal-dependent hydrolase